MSSVPFHSAHEYEVFTHMKIIRCRFLVSCLMLALTTYGCSTVRQGGPEASDTGEGVAAATSTSDRLQLSDGDRVVFLGNSLFEEDLRYGLLEYTLATRFSDREVTFRNLGWSGDTVFGESRGYFTTPPDAYGHLIKQLTESEPTSVFIAYGAIESLEGEVGIRRFREGLESLLDTIDELGAEAVLLSPVPHFQQGSPVKDLDAYQDRKSTRLNSSHVATSYAVFCLEKKNDGKTTPNEHVSYEPSQYAHLN